MAWTCVAILGLACHDSTGPSGQAPYEFITVRRAWRPGERDSLIARIIADSALSLPWAGNISSLAPQIYADTDSVVVIVRNPAYPAATAAVSGAAIEQAPMPATWGGSWSVSVIDVRVIDTRAPADTFPDDVGIFWYNMNEPTWHGIAINDRCRDIGGAGRNTCMSSRPPTTKSGGYVTLDTDAFDAAADTIGAGGGELRSSTGYYWKATGGTFEVKSASYGGSSTLTSGPFLGGTSATGTAYGDLNKVVMTQVTPQPSAPTSFTTSLDFRGSGVSATRLTCVFPNPCTTNAVVVARTPGRRPPAVQPHP
jgi:hypothetical protein